MATRTRALSLLLVVTLAAVAAGPAFAKPGAAGFDPKRNASKDLEAAVAKATAENKRILLELGGEWCSWCHKLEKFLRDSPEVRAAIDAAFVVVKVNVSPENENTAFLSGYPEVVGFPHLFVLEGDGTFLHSQETGALEAGESYDAARWLEFVKTWGAGS